MNRSLALLIACFVTASTLVRAEDWPAFRGAKGDGVSNEKHAPLHWGPDKNIKWKIELPGPGNSSPVVSGTRVFLTCAKEQGRDRGTYCYDRNSGQLLWSKHVVFEEKDPTHNTNPYCGSSAGADGKRVVVWHGSAGLYCYDYDGNELWKRDLGEFKHIWGYGQSPVFYGEKIILNCGPGERTFVTAIDAADGKTIWQVDEPGGSSGEKGNTDWIGSWSTPTIAKIDGRDQILVSLPYHLNAYDPNDGRILWTIDGLGKLVYTSVVIGDGVGVAMSGFHGPAMGFKLGGAGNITESNRLWLTKERQPQRIGTGIFVGKLLYMVNENATVQCLDVETGKDLWPATTRLPQGTIWGSPVLVDGRFYVTNQNGNTIVFKPGAETFELLAENKLDERSNSTPAVSNGQIFVRTYKALYCIEDPAQQN